MFGRLFVFLLFLPVSIPFRNFFGLSSAVGFLGWIIWIFFTLKWACELTDAGFSVVRAQACLSQFNSRLSADTCGRDIALSQLRFVLDGLLAVIPSYYILELLVGWRSFSSVFDICWTRIL